MDLMLEGKTAVVTGGLGGLGLAIARGFSAEGATPVVIDIHPAEKALAALKGLKQYHYLEADLSRGEQVERLVDLAADRAGPVDILVNCAAVWPTHLVVDTSLSEWEKTLAVDLTAPFLLCRDFVRQCLDHKAAGVILNVVSQAAFGGATSGHADYAAGKAALVNLTRSLAHEVAARGIRVNAIAPGMMETHMSAEVLRDRREKYLSRIPLGRIAAPAEVADVAVFLCSPRAGYMTGATVDVSGGMLMH